MLVILLTGNVFVAPMVPIPVGGMLALLWARSSGTPLRALGYVRPRSWPLAVTAGIVCGVGCKLLMKAVVLPLFGADPINHAYHFLAGNRALLPAGLYTSLVAALGEETVFRGYLFERIGRALGGRASARAVAIVITSLLFAAAHLPDQGWTGALQALFTGAMFATMFAVSGSLALPMVAHAAFDLTAIVIIVFQLETRVAHLLIH